MQPCRPVRQIKLSIRPAGQHRLSKSIPGLCKRLQIRALYFLMIVLVPMRMFVSEGAVISVQARHWSWHRRLASSSFLPVFLAGTRVSYRSFLKRKFVGCIQYNCLFLCSDFSLKCTTVRRPLSPSL
jgi:hypothetical protein